MMMCWHRPAERMKSEKHTTHHVWARALWAYLDLAELARVPVQSAFEGMPFDAASLRARWTVSWDDFCTVTERLEELCGGPARCQELLRQSYHQVLPELGSLVGSLMCPVSFTRLALGVISPRVYQGCAFAVKDTGRNRVRVELRLRSGARPSLTFFRATVGELEALPRHLGLAPARVSAELSAVHGDYDVLLPPSRSVTDRALAAARTLELPFGFARSLMAGADGNARGDLDSRLTTAEVTWSLTSRQVTVLRHVARGDSNKEIAEQLGCAENTVEHHVTQLLQKARVPSRTRLMAHFWASF